MYGFTSFGKSNFQIDGEMPTYFKGEESSATLSARGVAEPSLNITDVVTHYHHPLIAFRPLSTDFILPVRLDYGDSKHQAVETIKFARESTTGNGGVGTDATLYYRIYLAVAGAIVDSYGVFVKNSNGEPIFQNCESNFVGIPYNVTLDYNTGAFNDNYIDVTVKNADRNYFMLTPITYCRALYGGFGWFCFAGIKYIDATTIRVGQFPASSALSSIGQYAYWKSALTLIEVGPDLY